MSMNYKDIVIITTWDNEDIIIEFWMEQWLMVKSECKSKWEDWIVINALNRFIKFSNIKNEQWKTRYISLPSPKEVKNINLTPEQRVKRDKMIAEMLEKTYSNRRKTFLETRKDILKQLAKSERRFKLQTTENKLEELNILRQKAINNTN